MASSAGRGKPRKNPLFGAAVVKAVLKQRGEGPQTSDLYESILRDLGVSDEQVEQYLADHAAEIAVAIRSHGRRGDR